MGTLRSAVQLYDGYSPIIRNMIQANRNIIASFQATETASGNAFNDRRINQAISDLGRAEVAFDDIEQQIREADIAQQRFNEDVRNGENLANGLKNKLLGVGAAIGAAFSAKKIIDLADTMTSTNARLNLIVDDGGSVEELHNKIMASANRGRAAYLDTASAITKLGLNASAAFSSTDEMIAFAEQMNKQFVIGGSSVQETSAAMYQLTQAMAAGKLQGDEFRSILENAPMLAQAISQYMGKPMGELKDMSREGLITSDVIKNALFSVADETEARFEQMPKTIGQVWTVAKNTILQAFNPVIQTIGAGAQRIYDNWATIAPIFYGIAGGVGVAAAAYGIWTAATWLQVTANQALLVSLLSNPFLWIAVIIGLLIAEIYEWVKAVGGLKVAWMIVTNSLLTAWDKVKICFFTGVYWVLDLWAKMQIGMMAAETAIENSMGDMKSNVLMILQNMVNGAIDIINDFTNTLNKIPGVNINAIEQVTFGTAAQLENEAAKQARNLALNDYRAVVEAGIAERQSRLNVMRDDARSAAAIRWGQIDAVQAKQANRTAGYTNDIYSNVGDIAENTAKMADSLDMTEEDLKYLRDIAEREAINRYTTAEITIEQHNENHISSEMDLDGVVGYLNEGLHEAIDIAAEGAH